MARCVDRCARFAAMAGAAAVLSPVWAADSPAQSVAPPDRWVPYAAETRMLTPGRPDTPGRRYQDERGCTRHELIDPDGSPQIVINNYEERRVYQLFRGTWSVRPVAGEWTRPLPTRPIGRALEPLDGFDVFESEAMVWTPAGTVREIQAVVPALNFLVVHGTSLGRMEIVTAIRVGPQPRGLFVGPASPAPAGKPAVLAVQWAIALRITFDGQEPIEIVTQQTAPQAVRMPSGDAVLIVTDIVDEAAGRVSVRVLRLAALGTGNAAGQVLDRVEVELGGDARTTRLQENFGVSVRRIGDRVAR